MNLLIDIGNSRIKWAQQSESGLDHFKDWKYNRTGLSESLGINCAEIAQPDNVYISNVAGEEVERAIEVLMQDQWDLKPVFFSAAQHAIGVTNGYDDNMQLGVDRWLAMIAGWNRYRSPVCILDCGTALTVDVVSGSGQHSGGYIVPGLSLMAETLNRQTQQIDTPFKQESSPELGQNTVDCISNGALMAILALVTQSYNNAMYEHGSNTKCIITGGYAEHVIKFLELDVEHDPYLVLNGIALMSASQR